MGWTVQGSSAAGAHQDLIHVEAVPLFFTFILQGFVFLLHGGNFIQSSVVRTLRRKSITLKPRQSTLLVECRCQHLCCAKSRRTAVACAPPQSMIFRCPFGPPCASQREREREPPLPPASQPRPQSLTHCAPALYMGCIRQLVSALCSTAWAQRTRVELDARARGAGWQWGQVGVECVGDVSIIVKERHAIHNARTAFDALHLRPRALCTAARTPPTSGPAAPPPPHSTLPARSLTPHHLLSQVAPRSLLPNPRGTWAGAGSGSKLCHRPGFFGHSVASHQPPAPLLPGARVKLP